MRFHRCTPIHARVLPALVAAAFARAAAAHDFWVQPDAFWLQAGEVTALTLQVGHGPQRQRSPIPLRRVVRFEAIGGGGQVANMIAQLHPGAAASDGDLRVDTPGTHVLVFETDAHAQSHLPSIRFNDYAAAEGLTPALDERRHSGHMDRDATEIYSRRAKTLVQVGTPAPAADSGVTSPLGLPLEIVPDVNPYAQPPPSTLPVHVLYAGRPLAGAKVKLTELEHDEAPLETQLTDAEGRARFVLRTHGSWLLNVVWTRVLTSGEADFETVFSSLSFGFPKRAVGD